MDNAINGRNTKDQITNKKYRKNDFVRECSRKIMEAVGIFLHKYDALFLYVPLLYSTEKIL